ncbi:STAS domain-containing protein [Streptomyces melanogenes]|uniref:STAS domain-containing protein n=1 Tax=Streptomyces melanogenes TaxID=67326 RepID=A0ABZ1XDS1_9ACTN|nr:STAS domain-containing protein [Streptomyces melanogenes]
MTLRISRRQDALIVVLPPEVDIGNAESVRADLHELCRTRLEPESRNGVSRVVVDWAGAPFLTMAGVAVLEDFRLRATAQGLAVHLVACGRWPRAVLRITGVDGAVTVHDTVDQALADQRQHNVPPGRMSQRRQE